MHLTKGSLTAIYPDPESAFEAAFEDLVLDYDHAGESGDSALWNSPALGDDEAKSSNSFSLLGLQPNPCQRYLAEPQRDQGSILESHFRLRQELAHCRFGKLGSPVQNGGLLWTYALRKGVRVGKDWDRCVIVAAGMRMKIKKDDGKVVDPVNQTYSDSDSDPHSFLNLNLRCQGWAKTCLPFHTTWVTQDSALAKWDGTQG